MTARSLNQFREADLSNPRAQVRVLNDASASVHARLVDLEMAAALAANSVLVATFTTVADPPGLETGFPLVVTMGSALQPQGIKVVRAENLTSPTTPFYEAVTAPAFTYSGTNLSIPFITGLEPSTQYRITFELVL